MTDFPTPAGHSPTSESWFHVALASIADGVIACDTLGKVLFLNPVAETLTGWQSTDAVGQPLTTVFKIINEASRLSVENPAIRALRDGVIVGLANHTLLLRSDGTEHPIDDNAAPIRNAAGDVAGVVLVFRDVSERKARERLASEAIAYADSIISTLREPFLVLDSDLRVQSSNAAFYRTFATSADDTFGRLIYELGNGQWDIARLRMLLGDLLQNNHAIEDFPVDHDFPELGLRHMLLNARLIKRPGNHSQLILLAIQDDTERKQVGTALANSEQRYRRLFESAKDGILILDGVTMKVVDANPFMSELLGYSRREFLGKELWQLGFFRDKNESQAVYRDLKRNGFTRYDHLPLETKLGRLADVEFVSNMYSEGGHPVAQCNIRDVGERSLMERKAADQTEALADLHRRKDEFLAMLGHELRNPLAPIANAAHLLRMQKDLSTQELNAHAIIERQIAQLTRLIDDLLEVSRITSGRIQLRPEWLTARTIVDQSVQAVRPLLDQRHHTLTVSVASEPIYLFADASRLEQVLVNLLINAAKYTDVGGAIWLTVKQQGMQCEIRVRDNGSGIAPDLLPRVFDLFAQGQRSLDRSQGGLGIGLALVKHITEMHQGAVEVQSTLGQGCEFLVRLPVSQPPSSRQTPLVASRSDAGPGLRILVVDDNIDSTESLAQLLQIFGHTVQTAHDGAAAMVAYDEFSPNVVLLDIGLPLMNGYEVAAKMRAHPTNAKITLVAMTGYGTESDRQRAKDSGFDHHFLKPVDFGKLQKMLADVSNAAVPKMVDP